MWTTAGVIVLALIVVFWGVPLSFMTVRILKRLDVRLPRYTRLGKKTQRLSRPRQALRLVSKGSSGLEGYGSTSTRMKQRTKLRLIWRR